MPTCFIKDATINDATRIYQGDCLQCLPYIITMTDLRRAEWEEQGIERRIHVITDAPYEDELHDAAQEGEAAGKYSSMNAPDFDGINDIRGIVSRLMVESATGWLLTFTLAEGVRAWRDAQQDAGAKWDTTLVWVKPDATPRFNGQGAARAFENITTAWCGPGYKSWNGGGKRGLYTHNCNWPGRVSANDGGHPTEKPLALMSELVRDFTNPGDIVIDPFMGSGTTGEACMRLGREFIGIDNKEKYFAMAQERLIRCRDQGDFFSGPKWHHQKMPMDLPRGEKAMKA